MTRIAMVAGDVAEPAEVVAAIRARRGGTLQSLDRILLCSPALAAAWNAYLGAVRNRLRVPAKLRELAICAVAVLNGADYELTQHEPEYLRAGGSAEACAKLRNVESALRDTTTFSAEELTVLQLTVEMTRSVRVHAETWDRLVCALPDAGDQVEMVAVIATYNMVSRFLIACEVPHEPSVSTTGAGR
jgi:alkylhydroperoxidase family enzyme